MAIKLRRGTDTQRLSVVFEEGEIAYTTDTKKLYIGDGVTAGGNEIGGTTAAELLKVEVHNATGSTVAAGAVVYLNGNTGNKPNLNLAKADAEATSSKTIGLVIASISNNANGEIATDGLLEGLNTSAFVAGDLLWLSDSVAGGVTTIIPDTPNHAVFIGYVVRAHATQGSILIHIQNGYELNELHDVKITSVANGDGLIYDSTLGYWKNSNTVTTQGNTFNAANKLVKLDGTAKLPAVDGSQLTNLPTPATPTLAQVTTAGNTTTNAITVGGLAVATNLIYTDTVNGRVGIGTTSPAFNLDIYGATLNNPYIRLRTNAAASGGNYANGIIFDRTSGGATNNIGIFTDPIRGHTTNADALTFALINSPYTRLFTIQQNSGLVLGSYAGSNIAPANGMIISGNVGIGTPTDAGYKLDVNGTARVSGGLTVATNLIYTDTANSRVGIGTINPSQPFHIVGRTRIAFNTGTSLHLYGDGTTSYIDSLTGANAAHDLRISAQNISFYSGSSYGTVYAKLFNTGNFALGNNPTDAGYKLDVNGTANIGNTLSIGNEGKIIGSSGAGLQLIANISYPAHNIKITQTQGTVASNISAILQIESTTKGVLFPRMTTTQKNAITSPASGLVVYDTTLGKLCVYGASSWETITST